MTVSDSNRAPAADAREAAAAAALAAAGFPTLRVRATGDVAALAGPPAALAATLAEPARADVLAAVRGAGFRHVALELADG